MRAVNLIPSEQRQDSGSLAGRSQGAAFAVLGLMAGVAILALLYGVAHHQVSSGKAEAEQLQAQAQQAQSQATQLAPYTTFVNMRESRAEAISQLVASRFNWAQAFHELARVLPKDASLSSASGTVTPSTEEAAAPAASATPTSATPTTASAAVSTASSASSEVKSATPPGSTPSFTIAGCATSQAEVASTLERLRLIDGVSEVTLQSSSKSGAGSSGGGSCRGNQPAFAVQVAFDALPTPTAKGPAALTSASATSSTASISAESGAPR